MTMLFPRYASVGVVNTLIHWTVFGILVFMGANQSVANLAAFAVAVTFSFLANSRWTFNSVVTPRRYLFYVAFMGASAAAMGWAADRAFLHPFLTLVAFSLFSLVAGFLYSKFFVFRSVR